LLHERAGFDDPDQPAAKVIRVSVDADGFIGEAWDSFVD
jgi:hypothetical protein